jgi:hypothetical protein
MPETTQRRSSNANANANAVVKTAVRRIMAAIKKTAVRRITAVKANAKAKTAI